MLYPSMTGDELKNVWDQKWNWNRQWETLMVLKMHRKWRNSFHLSNRSGKGIINPTPAIQYLLNATRILLNWIKKNKDRDRNYNKVHQVNIIDEESCRRQERTSLSSDDPRSGFFRQRSWTKWGPSTPAPFSFSAVFAEEPQGLYYLGGLLL